MRYLTRLAAVIASTVAVVALGASAAGASVGPTPGSTVQCQTALNCVTPDVYRSAANEPTLTHPVNAPNAAVTVATADNTDPAQDWRYHYYGTVATLTNGGDGPFLYGLTRQDYAVFGDAPVIGLSADPGGFVSNLCLANINGAAVLRTCRNGRWQRFIVAQGYQFGIPLLNDVGDGYYLLSDVSAASSAGHNALTGATGQAYFSVPSGVNNQNWDSFDPAASEGLSEGPPV